MPDTLHLLADGKKVPRPRKTVERAQATSYEVNQLITLACPVLVGSKDLKPRLTQPYIKEHPDLVFGRVLPIPL